MGKKNYGKSVKTRLLNLMNETGYKYMYLLARYFNERLLYRVSVSQYKDKSIIKGYLAAGPYVGFRVGGDKLWDIPGSVGDQLKAKSFNAGLNLGAGVELIKHLQVGFNYALGLTDDYSASKLELNGKNRGWSITAAILF